MMRSITKHSLLFLLLVVLVLLVVSCSPGATTQTTIAPALATQNATEPAATATQLPTATTLPGKVLLVAPAGADTQGLEAALAELSGTAGLTYEKREALQKEQVTQEIKVVVSLDAGLNLAEMAAAAPQTQFVAISGVEMPAAGNVTVIQRRLDQQAFVAGFISALLSTDYRAGGMLPEDGPLGARLQEAFKNGASYFCGVCAPGYPLNVYYPITAVLPGASDGASWQSAAAGMFDTQKVEVFYISAEAARPEIIAYLQGKTQADKPVLVVGEQAPPEELKAQWAATVRFDTVSALRQAWPDLLAGKGGATLEAALTAENPDATLLGEGRMRLVKELIAEIQAGRVALFSVSKE